MLFRSENFSRELLELFTTGIGHYTENDVREGARALTGWTFQGGRGNKQYLDQPRFVNQPQQHDDGRKTYLGQTGNFRVEDIIRLATSQPATATFVSRKLHRAFLADTPDDAAVRASADTWTRTKGDVMAVLTELLASEAFYASRSRIIRSPVEFLVGGIRTLGQPKIDARSLLNLAGTAGRMGQVLLEPDTVKGWDGGREWINDTTLLLRMQVAAALTMGSKAPNLDTPPSLLALTGQERPAGAVLLSSLKGRQRTYLSLISPEFQLA